jgi:uncharacterized protein (DUF433 family)
MTQLDRITFNPSVMGGKPCIRGMRVTVGTIVGLMAAKRSRDEILKAYPYLEDEDIAQALSYAAGMSKRDVFTPYQDKVECPFFPPLISGGRSRHP